MATVGIKWFKDIYMMVLLACETAERCYCGDVHWTY